jgi:hypothetical protein
MSVSKIGHALVNTTVTYYAHLAPNQASKHAVAVLNRIEGDRKDDETKKGGRLRQSHNRNRPVRTALTLKRLPVELTNSLLRYRCFLTVRY